MTYVDFFILGIVAVSMLVGFFRGFFPELLGVLTWVAALLGGWHFGGLVVPYLTGKLGSSVVELWAARTIVFVIVLIVGGLLGQLVALVVDKAGLSGTDKMLGLAFGLVRGVLIVGVLVMFAQIIGFPRDAWWSQSALVPYGERIASAIRAILPDSVKDHLTPTADDSESALEGAAPVTP